MIEFPFIGGSYQGRSLNLNAQVCQNLYPVMDKEGGKSVLSLMGIPGMLLFCTSGTAAAVRGMCVWGDYLYAVVGNTLYMISTAGVPTSRGTLSTSTGTVWMVGGTTHLCIVDGTKGYYKTFSDAGLSIITDVDFPVPTSLTYQDGYFIVTESGTDSFHISASEDASSWDGLDFASAEDTPDEAMVIKSHNRELWIFGERTTEVFYNSGDADFPFSRVSGGVIRLGCGAAASVVSMAEGIIWLDDNYRMMMATGYTPNQISTPAIEYAFQQYATKSDAIAFSYRQEGHTFYQITFPTESRTWCYDLTTGFWHTRVSGTGSGRHRANAFAYFNGKNLVGDWQNGNIYELDLDTYTDVGGAYIVAKRACQAVHNGKKRVFHHALELDMETGVGTATTSTTSTSVASGTATWAITTHGLSLADGVAFVKLPGVDLSTYAGVAGSSTPYKLTLTDVTLTVDGWIAEADAAETLGSELVTNGDFATDSTWTKGTGWTISTGAARKAAGTASWLYQDIGVEDGKLYKFVVTVTRTAGTIIPYLGNFSMGMVTASGTYTYYATDETGDARVQFYAYGDFVGTLDDISVKEVTHVGATGVHIVSAQNGSTRNWETVGTFGYNTDYIYDVSLVTSVTGETDPQIVLDWSDDGGHTWSNEHWTDMGAIGVYGTRARWSKLGSSRQRVYRVSISAPVKRVIIGAYLDASEGSH